MTLPPDDTLVAPVHVELKRWTVPCRIGVWGTFDIENYGDALLARILRREFARRLPEATIQLLSPRGFLHPTRLDGGEPAEPLGRWSLDRIRELTHEFDCTVIGPGEILHQQDHLLAKHYDAATDEAIACAPSRFFFAEGADTRDASMVWLAVGVPMDLTEGNQLVQSAMLGARLITVRDRFSQERLRTAGLRTVELSPDPGILTPRLFPATLLERRLAYVRHMGWYPPGGEVVLVQGNADLVRFAPLIAESLSRWLTTCDRQTSIVLVELSEGHGDHQFADTLSGLLPFPHWRLPTQLTLEDIVATIAGAQGFLGVSLHGNVTALAFGKTPMLLNLGNQSKLQGFAELIGRPELAISRPEDLEEGIRSAFQRKTPYTVVGELRDRVDRVFDRVAQIAVDAYGRRRGIPAPHPDDAGTLEAEVRLAEVLRAHEAQSEARIRERLAFAEVLGRAISIVSVPSTFSWRHVTIRMGRLFPHWVRKSAFAQFVRWRLVQRQP